MPQYKKKDLSLVVDPNQRWFTIAQAASYMQICQQSVRSFIHRGELRASRLGATYRLDRHTIDEFIVRRERVIPPYRGSQKETIAGQFPWIADENITVSKIERALESKQGAYYERIVTKIAARIEATAAPFVRRPWCRCER